MVYQRESFLGEIDSAAHCISGWLMRGKATNKACWRVAAGCTLNWVDVDYDSYLETDEPRDWQEKMSS